ncbi:MAG: RluA family pseudouridine synthase [Candidatus Omnitrophica bacterium]|nr:RluA family pseudouridine synthase [Candidatus Omnitrophota bacterium]
MTAKTRIPRKYQPKGFEIIFEDEHLIVGEKAPGLLSVGALWERQHTVHNLLNQYVRKGNSKSNKVVFVVHRLDQATSGLLIFAKSERVQQMLKDNWKEVAKTYYAVVHGRMERKAGEISSYLTEDEDYVMHSSMNSDQGKLAHTAFVVVKESARFSLLKINLLTGRKNQIRVHLADEGHPVVGDDKYNRSQSGAGPGHGKYPRLALHSQAIAFAHPVTKEPLLFETAIPEYFTKLLGV